MNPRTERGGPAARTIADALDSELRAAILRGEIPPGAKLNLEDLRSRFGVSLSPLREALSRLAAEGLVLAERQRGYRLPEVSGERLAEVITLRCQLEPFALTESIRRGDDAWEERLVAVFHRLSKLERAEGRSGRAPGDARVEDWERAHREFHEALIAACGMPVLLQFCAVLNDFSDRYRRLFLARNPLDRNVLGEHRAILDAALARKAGEAAALLRQHVERTGANVLRAMAPPGRGPAKAAPVRGNGARRADAAFAPPGGVRHHGGPGDTRKLKAQR
ncbi:MAG: FCD domain-containing protein [Burkholderiales bacterium]|nr:FCD domain-containing protein [Burkholderiales bacterium]